MENWDNSSGNNGMIEGLNELLSTETTMQTDIISPAAQLGGQDVFSYNDPLKYSHLFEFTPLNLNMGESHIVKPHYVDPYIRQDGTLVDGYYRDGDGDTSIDRPFGMGGGYMRSNPGSGTDIV